MTILFVAPLVVSVYVIIRSLLSEKLRWKLYWLATALLTTILSPALIPTMTTLDVAEALSVNVILPPLALMVCATVAVPT